MRSVLQGGWARQWLSATPLVWVNSHLAPSNLRRAGPRVGETGRLASTRRRLWRADHRGVHRGGGGQKLGCEGQAGCTGRSAPKVQPRGRTATNARASRMLGPTHGPRAPGSCTQHFAPSWLGPRRGRGGGRRAENTPGIGAGWSAAPPPPPPPPGAGAASGAPAAAAAAAGLTPAARLATLRPVDTRPKPLPARGGSSGFLSLHGELAIFLAVSPRGAKSPH